MPGDGAAALERFEYRACEERSVLSDVWLVLDLDLDYIRFPPSLEGIIFFRSALGLDRYCRGHGLPDTQYVHIHTNLPPTFVNHLPIIHLKLFPALPSEFHPCDAFSVPARTLPTPTVIATKSDPFRPKPIPTRI